MRVKKKTGPRHAARPESAVTDDRPRAAALAPPHWRLRSDYAKQNGHDGRERNDGARDGPHPTAASGLSGRTCVLEAVRVAVLAHARRVPDAAVHRDVDAVRQRLRRADRAADVEHGVGA